MSTLWCCCCSEMMLKMKMMTMMKKMMRRRRRRRVKGLGSGWWRLPGYVHWCKSGQPSCCVLLHSGKPSFSCRLCQRKLHKPRQNKSIKYVQYFQKLHTSAVEFQSSKSYSLKDLLCSHTSQNPMHPYQVSTYRVLTWCLPPLSFLFKRLSNSPKTPFKRLLFTLKPLQTPLFPAGVKRIGRSSPGSSWCCSPRSAFCPHSAPQRPAAPGSPPRKTAESEKSAGEKRGQNRGKNHWKNWKSVVNRCFGDKRTIELPDENPNHPPNHHFFGASFSHLSQLHRLIAQLHQGQLQGLQRLLGTARGQREGQRGIGGPRVQQQQRQSHFSHLRRSGMDLWD